MKVGDLIRTLGNGAVWLVMDVDGDSALVQNAATNLQMWTTWNHTHYDFNYEVVSTT